MSTQLHYEGSGVGLGNNILDLMAEEFEVRSRTGFNFDEPSTDYIPGVFVRMWTSKTPVSLEKAQEGFITQTFSGRMDLEGQEYGYSEYTVEGVNILNMKMGGHDIPKIIHGYGELYVHILIDLP